MPGGKASDEWRTIGCTVVLVGADETPNNGGLRIARHFLCRSLLLLQGSVFVRLPCTAVAVGTRDASKLLMHMQPVRAWSFRPSLSTW